MEILEDRAEYEEVRLCSISHDLLIQFKSLWVKVSAK